MARPQTGIGHVDALVGREQDKRRLKIVLSVLNGVCSIEEACEQLGIGPARFHMLRKQALEGALAALAPKPAGRPRKDPPVEPSVESWDRERRDLLRRLQAAEVREEIALTMPHLLHGRPGKKTSAQRKARGPDARHRRGET